MAFGRLPRRVQPAPLHDINVTPLVDVLLVLLVVFMLAAPVLTGALRVALPPTDRPAVQTPADAVQITLALGSRVQFNGQEVDRPAFARRLSAAAKRSAQTEVLLSVDVGVPYGEVAALMAAVQDAGLTRMGFVTQPRP